MESRKVRKAIKHYEQLLGLSKDIDSGIYQINRHYKAISFSAEQIILSLL